MKVTEQVKDFIAKNAGVSYEQLLKTLDKDFNLQITEQELFRIQYEICFIPGSIKLSDLYRTDERFQKMLKEIWQQFGFKRDQPEPPKFWPVDSLDQLRKANRMRCPEFGHGEIEDWSLEKWGIAIGGEVGELLNILKKIVRGDEIDVKDAGKELADVIIYADMIAQRLGLDLRSEILAKFNEVSDRIGSVVRLPAAPQVYVSFDFTHPSKIVTS